MTRLILASIFSIFPLAALALEPAKTAAAADEHIELVANDLRTLGRVAEVAEDLGNSRQVMLAILDSDIRTLRMPREDGSFRWASLQREEGGRVSDEKRIERVYTEDELRYVTLTAQNAYRLVVTVPPKQGLITANNRVWVRNVIVESTGADGKVTRHEIPVNAWVNPGDATTVPFPEIGTSVKATAELGVENGGKSAVAEVALLQAKLVDDPRSPYFPAVQRLHGIRELVAERSMNRGRIRTAVDEALVSTPGELEKRIAAQNEAARVRSEMAASGVTTGGVYVGDATPDVVHELAAISRLLAGTLEEQGEGRRRLEMVIAALTPKRADSASAGAVR